MRHTAALIITAAGSSTRFRSSTSPELTSDPYQQPGGTQDGRHKEEFHRLLDSGLSVLQSSLMPFISLPSSERAPLLIRIIVTCTPGLVERTREDVLVCLREGHKEILPEMLICIEGGETRQDSVRLALEEVATHSPLPDYVLIHDGARPWVTEDLIERTFAAAVRSGGAVPALRSHDAIKRIDSSGMLCGHLDRDLIVGVQTPQIFRYPEILHAHRAAREKVYVDDTEIFMDWGGRVEAVAGDPANRKVTVRQDVDPMIAGNGLWCRGGGTEPSSEASSLPAHTVYTEESTP